jgi:hypothetical protein
MAIKPRPGRPSRYTAEIGQKIADQMATGLSLESAAAACGIGPRTVYYWQREHDQFLQAIEEGRSRSLLFWERRAIALAEGQPGNAGIISLALRNRSRAAAGWHHDSQRVEVGGPNGGAIRVERTNVLDISAMDDDQLDALEAALRATVRQLSGQSPA